MAGNNKTQRIPEPKTTKLSPSRRTGAQGGQNTRKRTRVPESVGGSNDTGAYLPQHAKKERRAQTGASASSTNGNGNSGGKGKAIAVAVTIVLLVSALVLSLAWGFGLFNKQDAPQQETTDDTIVQDSVPVPEPSGDASDVSYTRYATGDVSLEYPSSWSVMTYEGVQTVVVTRGTIDDGYIKIAPTSVSSYGTSSVTDNSSMQSFVSAVTQREQIDVDSADLSLEQKDGLWVTQVPLTAKIGDRNAKGVLMIAASENEAYLITALCPTDTYAQNWPYFQHVLDSISFNASAEFPDEGRD